MAQLLVSNKPTTINCFYNPDHEIDWGSNKMLFKVNLTDKLKRFLENEVGYRMHDLVPEILVWDKSLDFGTVYIARAADFDEVEMF